MTEPTENGPNSLSIQDQLKKMEEILDEYESKLGLPAFCPQAIEAEATRLLRLTPQEMSKLAPDEKGEASVTLKQFAFYIQKAFNKEQARVHWAEERVKKVIAPGLAQQKAYAFEERKLLAIQENDAAIILERIRVNAQARVDRLSFITHRIEALAMSLFNIQRGKYGKSD
jgi:hypothetical protein